jgi:hypothetical protein
MGAGATAIRAGGFGGGAHATNTASEHRAMEVRDFMSRGEGYGVRRATGQLTGPGSLIKTTVTAPDNLFLLFEAGCQLSWVYQVINLPPGRADTVPDQVSGRD